MRKFLTDLPTEPRIHRGGQLNLLQYPSIQKPPDLVCVGDLAGLMEADALCFFKQPAERRVGYYNPIYGGDDAFEKSADGRNH